MKVKETKVSLYAPLRTICKTGVGSGLGRNNTAARVGSTANPISCYSGVIKGTLWRLNEISCGWPNYRRDVSSKLVPTNRNLILK
ncbi:hypothetical protein BaRGS_00015899 [Batillaria attramentaria]|uniref:Uncharacterized protein n=1 Tax=Batillaria attramentaria TaxID=370345 RepID=A0ABD0L0L8_9CAEN